MHVAAIRSSVAVSSDHRQDEDDVGREGDAVERVVERKGEVSEGRACNRQPDVETRGHVKCQSDRRRDQGADDRSSDSREPARQRRGVVGPHHDDARQRDPVAALEMRETIEKHRRRERDRQPQGVTPEGRAEAGVGANDRPPALRMRHERPIDHGRSPASRGQRRAAPGRANLPEKSLPQSAVPGSRAGALPSTVVARRARFL